MDNIIKSSLGKIRNYATKAFNDDKGFIQRGKFTPRKAFSNPIKSPVPKSPPKYGSFGYKANNAYRSFLRPVAKVSNNLRQAAASPTQAGSHIQRTILKAPLPRQISQPVANFVANSGQLAFSGMNDFITGVGKVKDPSLGKWDRTVGGMQVGRGVSKLATPFYKPAAAVFSGANVIASSGAKQKSSRQLQDLPRRFSAGIVSSMSGEESAGSVPDRNVTISVPFIGDVTFDPAKGAGGMAGFVKQPINQMFFKATNTLIPTADKGIKMWLATTAARGGLEDLFLSLPGLKAEWSPTQKAQYLITNIGQGVVSEILMQGAFKGLDMTKIKSAGILKEAGVTDYLAKQFDTLREMKRFNMLPINIHYPDIGKTIKAPQFMHDTGLAKLLNDNRGFIDPNAKISGDVKPDPLDPNTAIIPPTKIKMTKDGRIKIKDSNIKTIIQDSFARVRNLQNAEGVKVNPKSDIYQAEELYHGRVSTRIEKVNSEINSIDADIAKAEKQSGNKNLIKKINDYLIARHAPERNAAHGDGAAGMTTKEANKIFNDIESSKEGPMIKELADKTQELNNQTLDILYEGQVISKELYDSLRIKYKNHIPLQRIMDSTESIDQVLNPKGFNVKGTGLKAAKGSSRKVSDVFGNITSNLQEAIMRSEKNKVNLATLEFVKQNPNTGLFKIIRSKDIGTTFDGKPILKQTNDPQTLHIRKNGKEVLLNIKDKKLAITLQGLGKDKLPAAFKFVNVFTRFYSALHTRFNPEFPLTNKARDIQEMAVYLSSQKDIGVSGTIKTLAKDPISIKSVTDSIRGVDSDGAKLYNQLRMDGGTTGGMALSTKQDVDLNIDKIRKLNRSNPRKAVAKVLEIIDNFNMIFEDSTRLSVYRQALESGATRERAASLAKNATLNFNRKGTDGPIINSLYMFSNASIQGTTKMLTALKNPKTLGIVTTVVGAAVFSSNNWNDQVDENWRDKVSDWDRKSNLVIMLPTDKGSKYITIPVSWGIKPLKVTADYAYDAYSGNLEEGTAEIAKGIGSAFIDAYNPAGGTDPISIAMPTIGDIPTEIYRNKSWSGGVVRPDWMDKEPRYKQKFKSTNKSLLGRTADKITTTLADKTNEVISISPNELVYGFNQYIGGAGRFITKSADTISSLIKKEDPNLNTIPFSSRFLKSKTAEQIQKSKLSDSLKTIRENFSGKSDTKTQEAYEYIHAPKTLDEYGFPARNRNESMAFAQIRLSNPAIMAREAADARAYSEVDGTPINPLYNLPYDRQRTVLTLATQPPGKEKSAMQKANIEWLKPYWDEVSRYSTDMKKLGIFKENPNYTAPPQASARAQAQMDAGNWNDPEVKAYLAANNEYKNKVRAELGYPPLEGYSGSGWGPYTKKAKKVSIKKVAKAKIRKTATQFKTRKIKTPKLKVVKRKAIKAPNLKIKSPKLRVPKFNT